MSLLLQFPSFYIFIPFGSKLSVLSDTDALDMLLVTCIPFLPQLIIPWWDSLDCLLLVCRSINSSNICSQLRYCQIMVYWTWHEAHWWMEVLPFSSFQVCFSIFCHMTCKFYRRYIVKKTTGNKGLQSLYENVEDIKNVEYWLFLKITDVPLENVVDYWFSTEYSSLVLTKHCRWFPELEVITHQYQ